MTPLVLSVPEISCDHCRDTIEGALAPLPGVDSVTVDIGAKSVEIDYDPNETDSQALVAAIEAAGYDVA
ncbi:heavy-metal-associated domain-containing protein [soil metagenome]